MSAPQQASPPVSSRFAYHLHTYLENPRPESAHFVPSPTRLFCEPLELATLLVRQALEEGEHTTDGDTSGGDDG